MAILCLRVDVMLGVVEERQGAGAGVCRIQYVVENSVTVIVNHEYVSVLTEYLCDSQRRVLYIICFEVREIVGLVLLL